MSAQISEIVASKFEEAKQVYFSEISFPSSNMVNLASLLQLRLAEGNKIAFIGNGGSAAEASHIAAEFTGKCVVEHEPFAAISLTDSNSALTAIANDYGVQEIFSRQVKALLRSGDILIALTTSGKSANILKAIEVAKTLDIYTVVWMGDFENVSIADEVWKVPSISTPRIQDIHLLWGHVLAQAIEEAS